MSFIVFRGGGFFGIESILGTKQLNNYAEAGMAHFKGGAKSIAAHLTGIFEALEGSKKIRDFSLGLTRFVL